LRLCAGAANLDGIPPAELPEVAFVGRSNVGKSSLVNALTGRKTLARVSNTPGRTREINFFRLGGRLMLADLPGYGYARVSRSDSERWTELVFAYLRGSAESAPRRAPHRFAPRADAERHGRDGFAGSRGRVLPIGAHQDRQTQAGELAKVESKTLNDSLRHGAAHPELVVTRPSWVRESPSFAPASPPSPNPSPRKHVFPLEGEGVAKRRKGVF